MQEIQRDTALVSANGGILDYVTEHGEVLMSVAVPPGLQMAAPYLDLCPEGARLEIAEGIVAVPKRGRVYSQTHGEKTETGANPDFQPSSADRLQRQMRLDMARMQADQRRLDARLAQLAAIERIPDAPKPEPQPEDAPVVE